MLRNLLSLIEAPDNEKGNGKGQQNNSCGGGVGHNLIFSSQEIDKNDYRRSYRRTNSIDLEQTHLLSPFTKYSMDINKAPAQAKDIIADLTISAPTLPVTNGATIPAANQATARLAQNSAKAFRWPDVNFIHFYAITKRLSRVKNEDVTFNWWVIDVTAMEVGGN